MVIHKRSHEYGHGISGVILGSLDDHPYRPLYVAKDPVKITYELTDEELQEAIKTWLEKKENTQLVDKPGFYMRLKKHVDLDQGSILLSYNVVLCVEDWK